MNARDLVPPRPTVPRLAQAAAGCAACRLHENATQTVFGQGPAPATVMMVGEQPGDREDREGAPFVGPAGRLLDEALERAGLDRTSVYITNAVKHFKFEPKGKRRIHKKPNSEELGACRPWLDAELAVVRPQVLVPLGATAAQALLGSAFRVTRDRGRPLASTLAPVVVATVHPSSILRAPDDETRRAEMESFVRDLRVVARLIEEHERAARRAAS